MNRKSRFGPFGAAKGWGLLSWTEAQPLAMLTAPPCCCLNGDGNFLPVLGIALAVNGHESMIELKSAVTTPGVEMSVWSWVLSQYST